MEPREMTPEEYNDSMMLPQENFGLRSKKTGYIVIGSDTVEFCIESLEKMGVDHPRYSDLELVKRPNNSQNKTYELI